MKCNWYNAAFRSKSWCLFYGVEHAILLIQFEAPDKLRNVLPCLFRYLSTWSCKHYYSICFGFWIKICFTVWEKIPKCITKSVISLCIADGFILKSNNIFKVSWTTREWDACLHYYILGNMAIEIYVRYYVNNTKQGS